MSKEVYLVVGLGNPGARYESTRHNAGFLALDFLFPQAVWKLQKKLKAQIANTTYAHKKLILLKPITFMNLSGEAVCAALRFFNMTPPQMLVLHDDIDLPEGEVRLKNGGGHRGHNGLRNIIQCAGPSFFRLRIGVGRPHPPQAVADYVLEPFSTKSLAFDKIQKNFQQAIEEIRRD